MISDVPEVLALWDDGLASRQEVIGRLFALVEVHGVDALLAELPAPWRDELVAWMRATFDNDLPEDEFVWLGNTPEPDGGRELIRVARAWLARNRG